MIRKEKFGMVDGREVTRYVFGSEELAAGVLDFGATLQSLAVDGVDVVLGFPRGEDYNVNAGYVSANVGRVANRIARGEFSLGGQTYHLTQNEGPTHLHGGTGGFHRVFYTVEELENGVRMSAASPDGADGYPGTLHHSVTYTVTGRTLTIAFSARSDRDTVWAPTSHIYFNLDGEVGDAVSNRLTIYADGYTPVDAALIPLGSVLPVRGTAFDFTAPRCVCRTPGEEYDINFVLRGEHAATLEGARSGPKMEMYTDMPCIQLYSGAADMDVAGKTRRYHAHEGVALEPQFAPNAVNVPAFKQPFLAAGKEERHFIRLEF